MSPGWQARLGGGACDIVGELMLMYEEGEPARPERERLWEQALANRNPPHSDVGAGGAPAVPLRATAAQRAHTGAGIHRSGGFE